MTDGAHNLTTAELLALLRDASLKPESIAEEMRCAGAKPCTAAQISEARKLLSLLQQERTAQSVGLASEGAAAEPELARRASALPAPLALAVVRAAGEAQRHEALVELASAAEKTVVKEAKRELQRLKQRGIQVQEIKPRGDSVLRPAPEAEDLGRFGEVVRFVNDILLSAPSIIVGLFVYEVMVVRMSHFSAWAGAVALAIIVVPVVVRATAFRRRRPMRTRCASSAPPRNSRRPFRPRQFSSVPKASCRTA